MKSRGQLRGVRHVEPTTHGWQLTLTCGHRVERARSSGRPTRYSSAHCPTCASAASASPQTTAANRTA
jgi:hypothetical protein